MMPGVARTNPTAAENAAIFAFIALPPKELDTPRLGESETTLWELRPTLSMTTAFELIQLPLQLLVVRIQLHGLLETLDLIVLVALLGVRLRHPGVGRGVTRIQLRIGLQQRERVVRLIAVDERRRVGDQSVLVVVDRLLPRILVLLNRRAIAALRQRISQRNLGDLGNGYAAMACRASQRGDR